MAGEIGYLVLFPASLSCLPSLLFIHFLGVIVFSVEAPMDSTPPPSENGKKFAFITPVLKDSTTTNSKSRGFIVLQKREGKAEEETLLATNQSRHGEPENQGLASFKSSHNIGNPHLPIKATGDISYVSGSLCFRFIVRGYQRLKGNKLFSQEGK